MLKMYEPAVGRSLFVLDFAHLAVFPIYLIQVTLIQYVLRTTLVSSVAEIKPRIYLDTNTSSLPPHNNAV